MSDGYHIALLIMAALYYLAPEFIKEKRLCWLHAPLYSVKNKQKTVYYFTDEDFNKNRSNIKGEISRFKGIGSMSSQQMAESMFTKEYQHLEIIEPSEEAFYLLQKLMGNDVQPRKEFIFNNVDFSLIRE